MITAVSAMSLLALGCQKAGDSGVAEKLDSIDKRLASIEAKLEKGGAPSAGRPKRPRRPRPNPKDVYAVPIEGAA